jgi:hypothetical protein
VTRTTRAEELWVAARSDAALRETLRAAHRGRLDVQDALWWRAHPLTPTPDGTADPASALAPLQAAVYSRDAPAAPERERRLAALTSQLAADAAALDATLARFAEGERTLPASGAAALRETTPRAGIEAEPIVFPAESGPPATAARPARPFLLVAAGVVLGVVATIGVQAIQGQPVPTDAAPASHTLTEYHESNPPPTNALPRSHRDTFQLFAQLPAFPEGHGPDLGPNYLREWTRQVGMPIGDVVSGTYVSRNDAGDYCLIVAGANGSNAAACGAPALVEKAGLVVHAPVQGKDPGQDGPDHLKRIAVTATWSPGGLISIAVDQSMAE